MIKTTLNHQSGTVLAVCDKTKEYLLGQFDSGYPGRNKHWIGRVKLLGGNYFFGKDCDKSPLETYLREIGEELSGQKAALEEMSASQEHIFASPVEIEFVRNALLRIEPLQDYCLHYLDAGNMASIYVIQSVFKAQISEELIAVVKHNLSQGKSLTNEGFLVVRKLDELISGNPLTQGATGLIIGQTEGVVLPHCLKDLFTAAPIGRPRYSYEAYSDFFEYRDHSKKFNRGF
ncbi:hypothetical protein HY484_01355 [Candidatus Woesearchaeota archaeon]|nr:hypothetical protein [Candidatus Woesearchaeota archaeon]